MPAHHQIPACEAGYPFPSTYFLEVLNATVRPDDRITIFGDSITWLGGYIAVLQAALSRAGLGNVPIYNRGINGGCVKDIRDGGDVFGQNYRDFNTAMREDDPTIVVIFIGTNDVRRLMLLVPIYSTLHTLYTISLSSYPKYRTTGIP